MKRCKSKVWRKPGASFQESPLCKVTQDVLTSSSINCDPMCAILFTREAHWRLSTQGFYWGIITLTHSAQRIPQLWLQKGLMYSANYTVCVNSLSTRVHCYQRMMGTFPKPTFLKPAKDKPSRWAFLAQQPQSCYVNSFLHRLISLLLIFNWTEQVSWPKLTFLE